MIFDQIPSQKRQMYINISISARKGNCFSGLILAFAYLVFILGSIMDTQFLKLYTLCISCKHAYRAECLQGKRRMCIKNSMRVHKCLYLSVSVYVYV